MSEDQFTKLFKYMQEFRHEVDDRFTQHDKRFDDLTNLIDMHPIILTPVVL